jgi:hypothetical protein
MSRCHVILDVNFLAYFLSGSAFGKVNDIQYFSEGFSVILVAANTLSKALSMPLMTTAGRALDPLLPYTPVFLNPIVDKVASP